MPTQSGKIVLVLVLLLLILGATVYFFLPKLMRQNLENASNTVYKNSSEVTQSNEGVKNYLSKDLKMSFNYPRDWFVNEKNYFLMVTSYRTKIGENENPGNSQIEIAIHTLGGCHKTIDENLKDPSCGELGPKATNEIVSKETEDLNGGKFHKYLVKYPSGKEQKFYFLEKGDRILQIDKNPDPSVFDKEFEDIIKSIKFI